MAEENDLLLKETDQSPIAGGKALSIAQKI